MLTLPADVASYLARFNLSLDSLLTVSNPKMAKGSDRARSAILHHLPHRALGAAVDPGNHASVAPRGYLPQLAALASRERLSTLASRHNGCPWATSGCQAGCLAWSGHGGLSAAVADCRGRRTLAMLAHPEAYGRAVVWAIARQWAHAQRDHLPLAVRLRGTDEGPLVGWHRLRVDLPPSDVAAIARRYGMPLIAAQTIGEITAICRHDKSLVLYDYSKAPLRGSLGLNAQRYSGWDITASLAADRPTAVSDAIASLNAGFRLAVPVALAKGAPLPHTLILESANHAVTVSCVDGDATDHRWADPHGLAVILRTKRSRGASPDADAFSLRPTSEPQRLPDGIAKLTW